MALKASGRLSKAEAQMWKTLNDNLPTPAFRSILEFGRSFPQLIPTLPKLMALNSPNPLAGLEAIFTDAKRIGSTSTLWLEREMFGVLRNPLFAWEAYRQSRKAGRSVPNWVLDYLDGVAESLGEAAHSAQGPMKPGRLENLLSVALGMRQTGQSGRGTAFSKYAIELRDLQLAAAMGDLMSESPEIGSDKAAKVIAKKMGSSDSTVARAYKKYASILEKPLKL
jgi:hypothetical protein